MAKATFLLLSILFSVTLLSQARNQVTQPEYPNLGGVPVERNQLDEPELLLPTEEQTPEKTIKGFPLGISIEEDSLIEAPEWKSASTESDTNPISEEGFLSDSNTISAVVVTQPLKPDNGDFRPIVHLHHMRVRRPFGLRFPRRCHGHHHHHDHRHDGFRREIPYGNDMIQFPVGSDVKFPVRNEEIDGPLTMVPVKPRMERGFDGVKREFSMQPEKFEERFGHVEGREEEEKEGFLRWIKKLMV